MLRKSKQEMGRMTTAETSTVIAFGVAVVLWVFPGIMALSFGEDSPRYRAVNAALPEGVAAILGAFLLFLLPGNKRGERAITWEQAVRIDWGVVLLYGGGYALGVLSFNTGLAEAVGRGLTSFIPTTTSTGMLIAACLIAVIVSETTSNTASANMVVPVVITLANASGIDPLEPAIGATMAASLGFMLPVSTPCNAIVYGSGYVPIMRMVRYGILLDVVGVIVVVVLVKLLVPMLR
jgi:sodium-dependent dicarboxylate transporter 2/3/5